MRKLFILLWLVSLSGCGSLMMAGVPGLAQIDLVTVMGTDKTVIDHVVSVSSGKMVTTWLIPMHKNDANVVQNNINLDITLSL